MIMKIVAIFSLFELLLESGIFQVPAKSHQGTKFRKFSCPESKDIPNEKNWHLVVSFLVIFLMKCLFFI